MIYINSDISKFFYYINFPYNSSYTLLKKTFINLLKFNKDINFNLLKEVCSSINLDWNTELYLLRRSLKSWYYLNKQNFEVKYPNINLKAKPDILNTIKSNIDVFLEEIVN